MTLFMTSWGGKKSSKNCGRMRATTLASQGKPFLILEGGTWSESRPPPPPPPPGRASRLNPAVAGLPAARQGQVPGTLGGLPSGSRAGLRVLTRMAKGAPSSCGPRQ